ncbi:MAG: O-acetyl-ADP-ribose deacetylase [Candidatus Dormibacterales bacterium]
MAGPRDGPVPLLGGRILVLEGDITVQLVDAVVNAGNSSLLGGGGVDGAIHRRGGPEILEACREIRRIRYPGGLPVGEAVATPAGRLPARWVVHTVGPVFSRRAAAGCARTLGSCYRRSLEVAAELGAASIAFPAISTGVYGYPRAEAARVAGAALKRDLEASQGIAEVRMVFFTAEDKEVFLSACGLR